jgi:hypothetical protein
MKLQKGETLRLEFQVLAAGRISYDNQVATVIHGLTDDRAVLIYAIGKVEVQDGQIKADELIITQSDIDAEALKDDNVSVAAIWQDLKYKSILQ